MKTPWKCFNCGFETTDEVKAAAHFGEGEGESALCIHWWSMEEAERAQAYQEVIGELNQERKENIILTTENKRLRQIVIDCYAGWSDEVLQAVLRGKEESHERNS